MNKVNFKIGPPEEKKINEDTELQYMKQRIRAIENELKKVNPKFKVPGPPK
ncbi:MAG: hypothetical protein ACOY46_19885 [Bacillota bacterium]